MRVLVTGMTARHVGRLDPFQGAGGEKIYHACPHIFVRIARSIGHDVDFREVDPREDLKEYRRVCVFVGPAVDPQMTFVHGALAALARRPDAIAFLDDWKVSTIGSAFRRMAARGRKYLWHSAFAAERPLRDFAYKDRAVRKLIEDEVDRLADQPWDRRVVVPLHAWGDHDEIPGCPASSERSWLDYTPGLTYPPDLTSLVRKSKKERSWLLATLGTRERWVSSQAPRWPVVRYGYKAERLSQADVMRRSCGHWGSLAPKYPHARASWWRPRFVYSAKTNTVVACDADEGIAKAAPQLYGLAVRYVEGFSDSQLRDLARAQSKFVRDRSWTWGDLSKAVHELLRRG